MTHTVPLAQLMDGQISALRHWARGRARPAGLGDSRSNPSVAVRPLSKKRSSDQSLTCPGVA